MGALKRCAALAALVALQSMGIPAQAAAAPANASTSDAALVSQIAQALRGIEMEGGDFLHSLQITFANGDLTQYEFRGSAQVSELAPADEKLFGTP